MTIAWYRRIALFSVALAVGCGDGGKKSEGENPDDGPMTDEFGAPLCPVDSGGWKGDDLALCDPKDESVGLFLHYGPKDYDDEEEVAKYKLGALEEAENCVFVRTTNKEAMWIKAYHGRMRPMSHHLIVTVVDELPEGVELGEPTECFTSDAVGYRWLLGSQDPQIDISVEGNLPGYDAAEEGDPEYKSGQKIEPGTILRINMHYVNTSEEELLRESWVYLEAMPADEVETVVDMITFFQGSINVPPQSEGVKTAVGSCVAETDRYVGMVTGHFHQNGTRFTAWHEKEDGTSEMIYDTRDWDLPGNAFYSDRVDNPSFDEGGIWGAKSGYVHVKAGEAISFQCEYDNPTNETITLGELGKDQMCNVFGLYYPSNGDVWGCRCLGEVCF